MMKKVISTLAFVLLISAMMTAPAGSANWPMKQRDMHNTGRADYTVSAERLNDTFFDVFLWQKRSPNPGYIDSTSMSFFDGAGPEGSDIVVGSYRWPKG